MRLRQEMGCSCCRLQLVLCLSMFTSSLRGAADKVCSSKPFLPPFQSTFLLLTASQTAVYETSAYQLEGMYMWSFLHWLRSLIMRRSPLPQLSLMRQQWASSTVGCSVPVAWGWGSHSRYIRTCDLTCLSILRTNHVSPLFGDWWPSMVLLVYWYWLVYVCRCVYVCANVCAWLAWKLLGML